MKGDIVGTTIEGNIKASTIECAALCSKNPECNSFESNGNVCNLNKESLPNSPELEDFIFCSKTGKSLSY